MAVKARGFQITDGEFKRFSELVYRESGIVLKEHKRSLLISRLSRRLRQLGLKTFQAYYEYVVGKGGTQEFIQMLDAISTNKTDFFREPHHFEFLRDRILPALDPVKQIRVWSAGCSTGEEPYTIAMTVCDGVTAPLQWDCRILASDLSTDVLEQAAAGVYDIERLQGLPAAVIRRHFLKGRGSCKGRLKVKPHLSDMVVFRRINFMNERYPIKTPLDIIFCRNVMIYFDRPTQERLVARFHRYLKPGGYLFIGHSESLQWVRHSFSNAGPTIYRKREGA